MIPMQPDTFVIALPRPVQMDEPVEARGMTGRVTEQLTREEYIAAWSKAGYPNLGICRRPNFFYRVRKDKTLTNLQQTRVEHAQER